MKKCGKCKENQELGDFHKHKNKKDGVSNTCKTCTKSYRKEYYKLEDKDEKWRKQREDRRSNKDRERNRKYIHKYGITLTEYDTMVELQQNCCAICGIPPVNERLVVDHCHTSGAIRGLLCGSCNRALGLFKDNISYLDNAKTYLNKQISGKKG